MKIAQTLQTIVVQAIVIGFLAVYRENTIPAWLDTIAIVVAAALGVTALLETWYGADEHVSADDHATEEEEEEAVRPPRPLRPDVTCPECFGAGYRLKYERGQEHRDTCQTCQGRREVPGNTASAYAEANPDR